MPVKKSYWLDPRTLIGIAIILIGLLILFDNTGFDLGLNLWDFWPFLLIFIGLGQVLQPDGQGRSGSGWVLIVLGTLFQLNNFGLIEFGFAELWPIILIIIGLGILKHSFWGKEKLPSESDYINLSFILGGGEHHFGTKFLKGGKVTAIMGGGVLDLRQADMDEKEISLDVLAFWGGIDLRVPEHWNVNIKASSILGGIDNKSTARFADNEPNEKTLIVTGMAIMGGVDIKN